MGFQKEDFQLSGNKYAIPEAISNCDGITLGNHLIRSVLLSTDLSYILNLNADAIMIVNPFEKSDKLNKIIVEQCEKPVFCDIGGGFLKEKKTIQLASNAFDAGAAGVVITKPTSPDVIGQIRKSIGGTLIYTIMHQEEEVIKLAEAGVDMFNISTGVTTADTVGAIKDLFPDIPLMANGGPYDSTIYETIDKGAGAIVFNPPTATEMLRSIFDNYRLSRG